MPADRYRYNPTVTSVTPNTGVVGTTVNIVGTDHGRHSGEFGSSSAAFVFSSKSKLVAVAPAHTFGNGGCDRRRPGRGQPDRSRRSVHVPLVTGRRSAFWAAMPKPGDLPFQSAVFRDRGRYHQWETQRRSLAMYPTGSTGSRRCGCRISTAGFGSYAKGCAAVAASEG